MSVIPKFNPFDKIDPKIYAYTTPNNLDTQGMTKIGYTEQESVKARIEQQTHTANVKFNLEWYEKAMYTDGSHEYFTDHDFHNYLVRFGGVERVKGKEWFKISPEDSLELFYKFADRDYSQVKSSKEHSSYTLRKEQQEAVDKTYAYYLDKVNNHNYANREFLWNAKPRFGKTLTAYDFMRKIDAQNVLIVTNRPSIANSWYDDFQKFIAWQTDYVFVSETDALSDRSALTRQEYLDKIYNLKDGENCRCVAFESLQGLKGSVYFGGEYTKLKWILDQKWDLLIIDEAHEGVDTEKTDTAFDKMRRDFTLHLSGTPFKAIAKGKFAQEQIYNWTFSDEQEAKENWQGDTSNPYASMPKMCLFTYQMSEIIQDKVNSGMDLADGKNVDYAFDLNEFFSTNGKGNFVYESDVKKFLNALTEQEKFPFSSKELRQKLSHTFWLFSRVDSVKAMAKLLKEHPVFENYEIIIAAGDGKMDEAEDNSQSRRSYDKVVEAIKEYDKTITLSVGQLTTGITIPEWTAVFMLSNMRSSAEYIQAAFRAQNPYQFVKDGKYYRKENAYVFDFSPERTLIVYDEFANSLYSSTASGKGTKEERSENLKRLINFFPVFAEDENGKMIELDAEKVLTLPLKIKSREVVNSGFMSNFLFTNVGVVYGASDKVVSILKNIKPEKEQSSGKNKATMEDADTLQVDENGEIDVPQEVVVNQTNAIFGEKIYEITPPPVTDIYEDIVQKEKEQKQTEKRPVAPEHQLAEKIAEQLTINMQELLTDTAKEAYSLKASQVKNVQGKIKKEITNKLHKIATEFANEHKVLNVEHEEALKVAQQNNDAEQIKQVQQEFEEKKQQLDKQYTDTIQEKTHEILQATAEAVVDHLETVKEQKKKSEVEKDIKAHLRGFARTIPSFIMAYGDDKLKLANFETYPTDEVFKEVTGISKKDFCFLRDGGEYTEEETGETKHFQGHVFDEVVFDESVQDFLKKKVELANYFDETSKKDIFDYIPPQETNQIFTPKKVVKMMVDELVKNDPKIFDYPNKTFVDFYMKSGLYITEIVKRLYNNKLIKSLYPDDRERIKHILENQVFGFAPTQIIYDIAMEYIFGFDEKAKNISKRNFFQVDTLPYAEQGKLQELVNEKLGDRIEEKE